MAASPVARVRGVVLAGGLSRRMGRDKAGVRLRGRSLLDHACDRLARQCAALVISRHDGAAGPDAREWPVVGDVVPGHAGPLAGILSALEWCAAHDPSTTHVATTAVDTPFLPRDFVSRLAATPGDAPVVCAASGGRIHPVAALWPVALAGALRSCMTGEGTRRIFDAVERFGFATAEWPVEPYEPFLNVNTPDDLARAEAVAAALEGAAAEASQ